MEITPTNITNFDRTERELQIFALFCLFVAGKNSDFAAKKVEEVLKQFPSDSLPFSQFYMAASVTDILVKAKVGQYNRLTKAINGLITLSNNEGLSNLSLEQLMSVNGIGPKTAAFFIMHSREGERHAILDTHILKWIRGNGYESAPKSTPPANQYAKWETIFFNLVDKHFPSLSLAEVDLKLWTEISGR